MKTNEATLATADRVLAFCQARGIDPLLIGAVALAAHGYPRYTEDLDLAVALPLPELRALAVKLDEEFGGVDLAAPDATDPLGGVITIRVAGALPIQLVNFDNSPSGGFPRLVHDALARAETREGILAKLPTVEDLIFFKLYAGGPKSTLDILELLTRTRVDLDDLHEKASQYRMTKELDAVLGLIKPTAQ